MPFLDRRVGDGLVRPDRRVAHEDVDAAELAEPALDQPLADGRIAHVAQPGNDADPRLAALARNHVELVAVRSEEHTSELQSLRHLVCRLLLEKKKKKKKINKKHTKEQNKHNIQIKLEHR